MGYIRTVQLNGKTYTHAGDHISFVFGRVPTNYTWYNNTWWKLNEKP